MWPMKQNPRVPGYSPILKGLPYGRGVDIYIHPPDGDTCDARGTRGPCRKAQLKQNLRMASKPTEANRSLGTRSNALWTQQERSGAMADVLGAPVGCPRG